METKKPYFDVYYQPGSNPVFCYRTGLTVYEETLYNGNLISSGYNMAGYPLNVLTNCATRLSPSVYMEPSSFRLELDGQGVDRGLIFEDFQVERGENELHAILTMTSRIKPIRIKIHTKLDGTAMFCRYIELENLTDEPMRISRMAILSGALEQMDRLQLTNRNDVENFYSLGYFEDSAWGREGHFAWKPLQMGGTSVDTRFTSDRYRHPAFFLKNELMGTMFFAQLAWSGGCRFSFDYLASTERKQSTLGFSAEIVGYAPLAVIRPRETLETPRLHMGALSGDLDLAINETHDHLRRSVLNYPEADASACLVGAGMGAEHDMSVETTKSFMRQMKEMGAEVFIVDGGWECPPTKGGIDWFGHNGKNRPDPDRYPNGIGEIRDYCHSLGMKFGLWIEIERLGGLSEVYKQHPEWVAPNRYDKKNNPRGQDYQGIADLPASGFLDFSNPEVAEWAESELARMIEEFKLDLLRVDYNISYQDYYRLRDTGSGVEECLSYRHFQAVYKMYRNLKKRFPNVLFENCAGGGGRTDLGIMEAFHHTWVSDWQKAPRSVMITNGMTMVLPPERVDRLFAGMGCHAYGSFALHLRNTMLGHISLNVIAPAATEPNPEQMAFVKHSIEVYKSFIRPILPTSKIYHHTPEAAGCPDGNVSILEIAAPNASKGAMTVITLTTGETTETVYPKGIDMGKTYRVTLDNTQTTFQVSGYELKNKGIPVHLPAALSSELVLYEAVEDTL